MSVLKREHKMEMEFSIIAQLLGAGGVIYLLVDKFFLGKKDKVGINKDVLGNGTQMVDLYKQIDDIVTEKTKPLEEKIDHLTSMLNEWGCYRDPCESRLHGTVIRKRGEVHT